MREQFLAFVLCCAALPGASGCGAGLIWACARPEMTAVSLNPSDGCMYGKDSGIPFYLPKPLLIISKNFRNIETTTVGLTASAPIPTGYDDQSKYADLNARTNFNGLNGASTNGASPADPASPAVNTGSSSVATPVMQSTGVPVTPGVAPSDGLAPETFFTYQIIYVPDMTKRYGLKIRGGPGEIRAAMNLVNGWQFTGTGPIYMKDSSTAQNILASGVSMRLGGAAAADVLNASANLAKAFPAGGKQGAPTVPSDDDRVQKVVHALAALPANMAPMTLVNYAEIYVYEPNLTPEGQVVWHKIAEHQFNRQYIGMKSVEKHLAPKAPAPVPDDKAKGALQGAAIHADVAQKAIAAIFGVPAGTAAVTPGGGERQGSAVAGTPTGGVNQIQVDCGGSGKCGSGNEYNLIRFGGLLGSHRKEEPRPKVQNKSIELPEILSPSDQKPEAKKLTPGGGLEGGAVPGPSIPAMPSIINQPIFNQPGTPAPPNPGKKE